MRPFVVDPVLTAIAIGYENPDEAYIADEVMPRYTVPQEKYSWTEYDLGEAFDVPDNRVGRTGQVNRVELGGTQNSGQVQDYGLDIPVPHSDIKVAAAARAAGQSAHDPEAHAVKRIKTYNMNAREIRVAAVVHNTATYAADKRVALVGTAQWSDYASSNPIDDFEAALEGTLVHRPNTIAMGRPVFSVLRRHPHIVNAVKGNLTDKGMVTKAQLEELFEVPRIVIGEAWKNSAKPGQPTSLARVWGKNVAFLYVNREASPDDLTFGITAQFGDRVAGRIEDEDVGLEGGVRIREGERVEERVLAKDVGYFIQNAVA